MLITILIKIHTTLAPVAPEVSLKRNISDGESSGSRRVAIQWTPSGMAQYDYFITVIPPIPLCMNSSVCSTSSTVMDLDVNLGIQYNVSVRAERCEGNVTSEESKLVTFKLTGIPIRTF